MATSAKTNGSLVYQRELVQDRETKGTFRFAGENDLTGRDVTLYIEKVDFKTAGIDVPTRIRVTVEAI